jgi:hypothetical protein
MFCRQCGDRLEVNTLFCGSCGAKANIPASGADPMRQKGNSVLSEQTKGFLESLFDFSFTSLVTTKLIKVLYGLSIAIQALISLFYVIISFSFSPTAGVIVLLIGAPLSFLLGVCYTRVMLEIIIVVFRISEHAAEIAQQGRIKEAPGEIKSGAQ